MSESATTPELEQQRVAENVARELSQSAAEVTPHTEHTPLQSTPALEKIGADIIGLPHLTNTAKDVVGDIGRSLTEAMTNQHQPGSVLSREMSKIFQEKADKVNKQAA